MGYIYKITNTQNGKIYIGQTVQSVSERWQKHIICAKRGFNNPNYKEVNMDDLLAMVSDGASNIEMAQRFGVSKPTLISKCKQYFGCTPSELRRSLC